MTSEGRTVRRVLIDTDPGVDDSMAILFAFRSPELQIEGLTTVYGNSGTAVTTENALRLVELAGRPEVPVAAGAESPLLRPFQGEGWRVHGRNGLGGVDFPPPTGTPDPRRAATMIVETIMASPGEITLIALGPLTNLAIAVALEPRIAEQVHEVVLMGGAVNGRGNASATSEANIRNDPEAAQIVFQAGWPVTMVGLDVTRQSVITPEFIERLRAAGNPHTDFIVAIVRHYQRFYHEVTGREGFPCHDSSAVAYVIDPSLFQTERLHVEVETVSPLHFGQTVADRRDRSEATANINVCTGVDSDRFLALYLERLTEERS